jgi:hypothetical protein
MYPSIQKLFNDTEEKKPIDYERALRAHLEDFVKKDEE